MATFNQYIRDGHFLSPEKFKKAQDEQSAVRNSTFFSALKRSGVMPEEQLLSLACEFFKVARVENAFTNEVDYVATCKVMGNIFLAIEHKMFAIRVNGKQHFVVNDPENEVLRAKAVSALGQEPIFALVSDAEFEIINQYQLTPKAISDQANQIKVGGSANQRVDDAGENASYTQKLLDMLITAALNQRASDLHLLPLDGEQAMVMLRVDGELYQYSTIRTQILSNLRNKLRTMSQVGGETEDKPVEGQISTMYKGERVDIRINILRSALGFDFNMRFIASDLKSLEELGLSETNYNHYMHLLHMTKGLVILCGPTGSGKTSLLYAGFKKLLAENKAIFTIEDPVEIVLPGTTQIQVKKERGMTYADRFPSALRHDPDVIGIGETRTLDVAEQTVQAANTGHLVFTTLHTNDAVGAISRLVNLGLPSYTIGDVLAAVVAQRLVRRVCTACAEEYSLPADSVWRDRYHLGDGEIKLKRGKGCARCAGCGYRGRIAVNEFLLTTPKIRNAIQKNATRTELEDILKGEGYRTYIEDAVDKSLQGITTLDEVDKLWSDIL